MRVESQRFKRCPPRSTTILPAIIARVSRPPALARPPRFPRLREPRPARRRPGCRLALAAAQLRPADRPARPDPALDDGGLSHLQLQRRCDPRAARRRPAARDELPPGGRKRRRLGRDAVVAPHRGRGLRLRSRRRGDRRRRQRLRRRPLHAPRHHLASRLLGARSDDRAARHDGGDRFRPRLAPRLLTPRRERARYGRVLPADPRTLAAARGEDRRRRGGRARRGPPARRPSRATGPWQRARVLPLHRSRGDRRPVGLLAPHGGARYRPRPRAGTAAAAYWAASSWVAWPSVRSLTTLPRRLSFASAWPARPWPPSSCA